ncbi:3924_t:CDS:1, partial [Gigaspora margarita]
EINTSLAKIKKLTDIDTQLLSQDALDANTYPDSIQAITGLKNTIYLARNLELENEKKETINGAILRRYTNFTDNTTKMIDSILQCKKGRVHFDNVTLLDKVITELQEIKEATKKHFQHWTKHTILDESEWKKWE